MVFTGIMATEAELDAKAGENVDLTGWTEANKNDFVAQAESFVNVISKNNWSDAYAALNADVKRFLSETVSNLSAIYGIQYNMFGYSSRIEAENMINLLWAKLQQNVEFLKDDRTVKFMVAS